ncbi:hypothetical protein EDB89DRAFT_1975843 [Lactarius sanguifluus]|nr:hypothetical protein EDB89DRAFT_2030254 [Lactarius sanguifluus]KAH9170787.1 hypothetical protein EDB89DRAFT_1975843 [Lactarius sanguifluus]
MPSGTSSVFSLTYISFVLASFDFASPLYDCFDSCFRRNPSGFAYTSLSLFLLSVRSQCPCTMFSTTGSLLFQLTSIEFTEY